MAEWELVETVFGKLNKYEIFKRSGKFYIFRDGKYHRGTFSGLRDAVKAAEAEG